MNWLNYHHLFYFWVVARKGSIKEACEEIHVTQPTITSQLQALEESLAQKLFTRRPRQLVLTEAGRLVYRYADEIFSLGQEMTLALKGQSIDRPLRLSVGVIDSLPKMIVYKLLEAAVKSEMSTRIVCEEGKLEHLLATLAIHELDLVLADRPIPPTVRIQAFHHLLGESGVLLFATPQLVKAHRRQFPKSLDTAPFLLPKANTVLRRDLDSWFMLNEIEPRIVGEFEDSAMQKAFGQAGQGIFPGSAIMKMEICRQYQDVKQRFYAHTVDRKLKHPSVVAISELTKQRIFRSGRK
ncbi:MAG: transcriptional activator NhaR [Nitrospirales bacterium]|nr:MAG: transcriptional activator NhaR [Nitrospirales bacterium]